MNSPYLYKHGLPFCKTLGRNLSRQQDRINKNKASLIIIDGGVGEGKTTLATHCADYLQGEAILFKEQHAIGGKQFLSKLAICYQKKHPVIVYDEAGDFNRRGALSRFNAMLNRTFETYRAFKIIVILVLPNFGVLDNDLFDKKIPRLLLNCWDRNQKYGNYRAYSLYRMLYIKDKMKKLTVKPLAYKYTIPNFYGQFKDLIPERSAELDKISTEGKIKELKHAEIKVDGLVTYQEMGIKLACSIAKLRIELKELQVKPVRYYEKKAYFDEGVIDMLADYMDKKAAEMPERIAARKTRGKAKKTIMQD